MDAWRQQHPGVVGYTYYSFRGPNGGMRVQGKGWRLDYTLVSKCCICCFAVVGAVEQKRFLHRSVPACACAMVLVSLATTCRLLRQYKL